MVNLTVKEATDATAGDSTKYGAPDIVQLVQVAKGTHATEFIQASSIETTGASDVQTDLDAKALSVHTHIIGDITSLQTTLDGKAASAHTHIIDDITNLQTLLDGKASSVHTHVISDVTALQSTLDNKIDTISNLGASGSSVLKQITAQTLEARKIIGGSNITVVENSDDITISSSAGNTAPPGFIDPRDAPYSVVMNDSSDQRAGLQAAMQAAADDTTVRGVFIPLGTILIGAPLLHFTEQHLVGNRSTIKSHSTFDFTETWTEAVTSLSTIDSKSYSLGAGVPGTETVSLIVGTNGTTIHGLGRYFIDQMTFDCDDLATSKAMSYTLQQNGRFNDVRCDDYTYCAMTLEAGQQHNFHNFMGVATSNAGGSTNQIIMRGGCKFMTFTGGLNLEKCGGTAIMSGTGGARNISIDLLHYEADNSNYPNATMLQGALGAVKIHNLSVSMEGANQRVLKISSGANLNGLEIENVYVNNQSGDVIFVDDDEGGHTIYAGVGNTGKQGYQREISKLTIMQKDATFPNHGQVHTAIGHGGRIYRLGGSQLTDATMSFKPATGQTAGNIDYIDSSGTLQAREGPDGRPQYTDDDGTTWKNIPTQIDGQITAHVNAGTSEIIAATIGDIRMPYDATIIGYEITSPNEVGSAVFDIWVEDPGNYPPTVADTITGAQKPTLTSSQRVEQLSISGWSTTTVTKGQHVMIVIDSASLSTDLKLVLYLERTT